MQVTAENAEAHRGAEFLSVPLSSSVVLSVVCGPLFLILALARIAA